MSSSPENTGIEYVKSLQKKFTDFFSQSETVLNIKKNLEFKYALILFILSIFDTFPHTFVRFTLHDNHCCACFTILLHNSSKMYIWVSSKNILHEEMKVERKELDEDRFLLGVVATKIEDTITYKNILTTLQCILETEFLTNKMNKLKEMKQERDFALIFLIGKRKTGTSFSLDVKELLLSHFPLFSEYLNGVEKLCYIKGFPVYGSPFKCETD